MSTDMSSGAARLFRRTALAHGSPRAAALVAGVFTASAPRRSLAANDRLQIGSIGVANRAAGRVTNSPEADRLIRKACRNGWEVA